MVKTEVGDQVVCVETLALHLDSSRTRVGGHNGGYHEALGLTRDGHEGGIHTNHLLSDNAHYDITPMRRAAVANITCIDSHPLTPVAPPTSLASGVTPTGESGADVVRRQHEHGAQPFPSRLRDAPRVGQVVGVEL